MTTPIHEQEQYSYPEFAGSHGPADHETHRRGRRSSDEDGTLGGEGNDGIDHNHLHVTTSYMKGDDHLNKLDRSRSPMSPSAQREQSRRLDDELEFLRAEREASDAERLNQESMRRSKSMHRSNSRTPAVAVDDFDVDTTPIHEKTKVYQPPEAPRTTFSKFVKRIHESSFLVRYFTYIIPVSVLLLIPTLLGRFVFTKTSVGGVKLFWFGIWLEIVWLTLWAARILAKSIPWPMGLVASIFTNSEKKWRDLGKQLELPATLFFWLLAIEISFLPTVKNHHVDGDKTTRNWELVVNKIIISIFVAAILNFIEKIIIQLIAISFHLRTYADRIEVNKFQISSLVKLYVYSKDKIKMEDSEFEVDPTSGPSSGARTPMLYVNKAQKKAQKNARQVFHKAGDLAGRVAGDFTGRAVSTSSQPQQVVLQLLHTTSGAQVLARRLYRTFAQEGTETVISDDLRLAFDNDEEADAAFTMFDKDLNGDISMEELEAVCVEMGRERKAITASLKDLDSVVGKLDDVFLFVVAVIAILVFISLISTSASGVLTSLGSSVLALSWLFSATAQEFLQSCIFVFVKHPFDVGDRVTIYGNTGSELKGDDYFVKEISLLFTEFKKMEGHVVQAPNSYLNTLFILNQRRSGGLAEAVPVTVKFGTTLEQIDTLRQRLLEFVSSENREYQKKILTELRTIYEAHSITLNVVFFYKSNWQNELLRLQRRNKFICAMMVTMTELGMEGPRMRLAGAANEFPMHLHGAYPQSIPSQNTPYPDPNSGPHGTSTHEDSFAPHDPSQPPHHPHPPKAHPSILRNRDDASSRQRGETISQMGKRVDFSLGMSSMSSGDDYGDIYDNPPPRVPSANIRGSSSLKSTSRDGRGSEDDASMARTSSRESGLGTMLSGGSSRTHRNRFFSSKRSKLGGPEEGTNLEDLEAGPREYAMADIPEVSGSNPMNSDYSQIDNSMWEREGRMAPASSRTGSVPGMIDPRTGIVSPQAVASDSALERGELPTVAGQRGAAKTGHDGYEQ
ncbi:uncharacterized protein BP5553_02936 [Venustampulla echinocandica]|uniref:Mechanosensitive ion channel protein n=1 Tax=Venustampulla echinocandica TaxID=2656787 RepID=A0A370TST0_9HELO|nr:uncharacterized protein BP5553_02936 [Venustampulla echinocandica]RDL38596.1 hypothetical protein BP5553_02936 [Venustampulla echinocandica]